MCGIAGIVKYSDSALDTQPIRRMAAAMSHRGPDADGFYQDDVAELAHKRLSIIDLSTCSNQPMSDHSGRYVIVFNGEIYNYASLKPKLSGYPFRSSGDTEVILAGYIKWGPTFVNELTGMFAFAIWDNQEKHLFLARDRMGVKPLYFYHSVNTFLFASEIRSLLASGMIPKKLNTQAVSEFLQYQSIGFPQTIIKNIRSMEAGTWMSIKPTGVKVQKYWSLFDNQAIINYSDSQSVKNRLRDLLYQSVERRMVSDVPVAAFLSGGIDSSTIVGVMSRIANGPVNTFTVGFAEKDFDESTFARIISKKFNTSHQEIFLEAANFLEQLVPALNAMDTPTGDGINSFVVSRAIRNSGIKVALSGVGGDELFAGYPIFKQFARLNKLKSFWMPLWPVRKMTSAFLYGNNTRVDRYRQILEAKGTGIQHLYPAMRQIVSQHMLQECTTLPTDFDYPEAGILNKQQEHLKKMPPYSQVSIAEYLGYTQHTLLKDMDQMSMANSLEIREPFFDHDLVKFVMTIPDELKKGDYPKQLLVESLGDLLPREVVHRKKQGFLFPWKHWMKNELYQFCESRLLAIAERPFVKRKPLMEKWTQFNNNDPSVRWMELWLFVVLEHWLQANEINE